MKIDDFGINYLLIFGVAVVLVGNFFGIYKIEKQVVWW